MQLLQLCLPFGGIRFSGGERENRGRKSRKKTGAQAKSAARAKAQGQCFRGHQGATREVLTASTHALAVYGENEKTRNKSHQKAKKKRKNATAEGFELYGHYHDIRKRRDGQNREGGRGWDYPEAEQARSDIS